MPERARARARSSEIWAAVCSEASRAPDRFFRPFRIPAADTDRVVRDAIDSLPPVIRQAIVNYTIELAEVPDPVIDDFPELSPFLWGYFSGYSADRQNFGGSFQGFGCIRVFKRNIERNSRSLEEATKHLRETFLHEIGHALGYDEEELEELGL